ncbi:Ribokinase [Baekduia alba]|uniref:ribokinase n=1 Tax=Baekduia alba TaxID=2997333 RepID=UPI00233FF531|nr:ribokinase [Baekduia alba]WCB93421.1 Ribokinase [Baekduia alba]
MSGPGIVVVGSANVDMVVYVQRAPALGETVAGERFTRGPGGKGANQAIAAARLGGRAALVGAIGDDDAGALLRDALTAAGVDVAGLRVSTEPTGSAHIVVDAEGANAIVVVPGANAAVTLSDEDHARIAAADAVLLQLEVPLGVVVDAATAARAAGTKVVLTPAPVQPLPDTLLRAVDVLVLNEHEARGLTGQDDLDVAVEELAARVADVVVTLGERGCLHRAAGAAPVRRAAFAVDAVDTTGAGDTFAGALAVARAEGRPWPEALDWASAAAALAVTRAGASAAMPDRAAVERLVAAGDGA